MKLQNFSLLLLFCFHLCIGKNVFENLKALSDPSVECTETNRVESECVTDTDTDADTETDADADADNIKQILHFYDCSHPRSRSDFKIKVRKIN